MGYYVRTFCKTENIHPLKEAIDYAKAKGANLKVPEETDIESIPWKEAELHYKEGKGPIIVECNIDDGSDDCLVKQECQEFIEEIGSPGISFSKRKVISHLKQTKFIITCQLLSDIDDDGYDANGEFLRFFMENCDGIIQADGEGFYKGNKLIVKLD
ncbi:hypothetical protein ACFLQP_00860 [Acidobacteriota bacterium]